MKAATLHAIWCPCFFVLDKGVENRSRLPPKSLLPTDDKPGPWIAMHASKSLTGGEDLNTLLERISDYARRAGWGLRHRFWRRRAPGGRPEHGELVFAKDGRVAAIDTRHVTTDAIVGVFRITGIVPPGRGGPWRMAAQYGLLVEAHELSEPVPCPVRPKGQPGACHQGWWNVPDDIEIRVLNRVPAGVSW